MFRMLPNTKVHVAFLYPVEVYEQLHKALTLMLGQAISHARTKFSKA